MIEIIIHGRGGQGAFTAAKLIGAAASYCENKSSLAFPSFGPERRGAPIKAFAKIDDSKIGDRSETKLADYVIYLDPTLVAQNFKAELKENGKVLINANSDDDLSFECDDEDVYFISASQVAKEVLGRDIPNTVFVAMIALMSDLFTIDDVKSAIKEYMPKKLVEKNITLVDEVASRRKEVLINRKPSSDQQHSKIEEKFINIAREENIKTPKLQSRKIEDEEFCHSTCWKAGWLITKNCGWRTTRPIVDEHKCRGCFKCYMACPDGCVFKIGDKKKVVAIDYDFCKGCGICAKECKFGAISMVEERKIG